jgi:hypothetical protein
MALTKDTTDLQKNLSEFEKKWGQKDSTGMVARTMRRAKIAIIGVNDWNKSAREDFRFALGDQWTEEEREKLKEQSRPCLTFNKIEPLINLVGGYERENSMRIRIFPEGGEDKIFSEIGDKALKAIDKWSKLNYKLDHIFDDGITCGKGWLEMAISYDDDIINGDLIFRQRTPFEVLVDPESNEYDHSDAEYMIKLVRVTRSYLKQMYPSKKGVIANIQDDLTNWLTDGQSLKEGDADNYHLGKETSGIPDQYGLDSQQGREEEKLYLLEHWYQEFKEKFFVFDYKMNKLEEYETEALAQSKRDELLDEAQAKYEQAMIGYQLALTQPDPNNPPVEPSREELDIRVIKRNVPEMYFCAVCGGELLQKPAISPLEPYYSGFPFFNYYASWMSSAPSSELQIKGITRNIKDANREINKSRSQFLHILNTSANSGWIGDEDALTPAGWKDLESLGSTPGVTIKKRTGKELNRIEPVAPSMAQILRGDKGESDIKEISGINTDALAIQDKTTSGRAISLRIKQALTILSRYFRNFRYTKEMIGGAIFAMLPEIFDVASLRKVLGLEFMKINNIDDGYLQAFFAQIKDGKYDVVITEADNSASIRQETFEQLMEMAQAGMPIPPDAILEFSAIPNSKEIIERVKAYIEQQAAGGAAPKTK